MGLIVYANVIDSAKGAHQHVYKNGLCIGEIWREQVELIEGKGLWRTTKWRWFARQKDAPAILGAKNPHTGDVGYGSKDKAVDALEAAVEPHLEDANNGY